MSEVLNETLVELESLDAPGWWSFIGGLAVGIGTGVAIVVVT